MTGTTTRNETSEQLLSRLDERTLRTLVSIDELRKTQEDDYLQIKKLQDTHFGLLTKQIDDRVTHDKFKPVAMIAYGFATASLTAVVTALLSLVILK